MSGRLLEFYQGSGRDTAGRTLEQVLRMTVRELEVSHDYIQWLFPLPSESAFNPDAPALDAVTIRRFREDEALRARQLSALRHMLAFYGLELDDSDPGDIWISEAETFDARARVWLTAGNHNYLRLTRIMKSLALLGSRAYALSLQRYLLALYRKAGGRIGEETLRHWRDAV